MEGIEFETDKVSGEGLNRNVPVTERWLSKLGVSDKKTANYILIGITVACFALSALVYIKMIK
ncbi:MAG: hypothetical protein PHS95_02565 [Candidatus Pacebacteria bacterium]|nr:hypothetical protein [Candidatus Paceibacterota bacterium]